MLRYRIIFVLLHKVIRCSMKQINDLMPLATLEDLRVFCQDYARKDKKFNKELTKFLAKLLSETDMQAWYSSSIEADIYIEEQDSERLFALLMDDSHHSLDMFDKYGHYLKSTYSDELIAEYMNMVKDYAIRNMGAKHYSRIRQAMEAMQKLNNGKAAAHQLAEHFRDVYRRRPSLMAEISQF